MAELQARLYSPATLPLTDFFGGFVGRIMRRCIRMTYEIINEYVFMHLPLAWLLAGKECSHVYVCRGLASARDESW